MPALTFKTVRHAVVGKILWDIHTTPPRTPVGVIRRRHMLGTSISFIYVYTYEHEIHIQRFEWIAAQSRNNTNTMSNVIVCRYTIRCRSLFFLFRSLSPAARLAFRQYLCGLCVSRIVFIVFPSLLGNKQKRSPIRWPYIVCLSPEKLRESKLTHWASYDYYAIEFTWWVHCTR